MVEEAGGRYLVVRDFPGPHGRLLSAVFGKPAAVERVAALFGRIGPAASN